MIVLLVLTCIPGVCLAGYGAAVCFVFSASICLSPAVILLGGGGERTKTNYFPFCFCCSERKMRIKFAPGIFVNKPDLLSLSRVFLTSRLGLLLLETGGGRRE